jgi:hypothetical protein
MWLFQLIIPKERAAYVNPPQDPTVESTYYGAKNQFTFEEQPLHMQYVTEPRRIRRFAKPMVYFAIAVSGVLTVAQWLLSAGNLIFLWTINSSHTLKPYFEVQNAVTDPTSIAPNMPATCIDYLKNNSISSTLVSGMNADDKYFMSGMTAFQFVFCTLIFALSVCGKCLKGRGNTGHTFNMVKTSASVTLFAITLPLISTLVYAFAFERGATNVYYTNALNATGGCTFATVEMNARWGYWDVTYDRPFRIAMAALGVL